MLRGDAYRSRAGAWIGGSNGSPVRPRRKGWGCAPAIYGSAVVGTGADGRSSGMRTVEVIENAAASW